MFGKNKDPKPPRQGRVERIVSEVVDIPRERAAKRVVEAAQEITRKAAEGR